MKKFAVIVAVLLSTACATETPLYFASECDYEKQLAFNRSWAHDIVCYECKWGMGLEEYTRAQIEHCEETGFMNLNH